MERQATETRSSTSSRGPRQAVLSGGRRVGCWHISHTKTHRNHLSHISSTRQQRVALICLLLLPMLPLTADESGRAEHSRAATLRRLRSLLASLSSVSPLLVASPLSQRQASAGSSLAVIASTPPDCHGGHTSTSATLMVDTKRGVSGGQHCAVHHPPSRHAVLSYLVSLSPHHSRYSHRADCSFNQPSSPHLHHAMHSHVIPHSLHCNHFPPLISLPHSFTARIVPSFPRRSRPL